MMKSNFDCVSGIFTELPAIMINIAKKYPIAHPYSPLPSNLLMKHLDVFLPRVEISF